ncbi:MAG: hypothetical protein WC222_07025 [Parachlamydiales bacterium]|jgi:adenosylhomocysteine nucleosidase
MNASPLFAKHEIQFLFTTFLKEDKALLKLAKNFAYTFFQDSFNKIFNKDPLKTFSIKSPQIHLGIVASGDQFVSDTTKRLTLIQEVHETLAVEMEGASVAQVCFEHETSFIINIGMLRQA